MSILYITSPLFVLTLIIAFFALLHSQLIHRKLLQILTETKRQNNVVFVLSSEQTKHCEDQTKSIYSKKKMKASFSHQMGFMGICHLIEKSKKIKRDFA